MSERGRQLHSTADEQIAALIDLVAALGDETARLQCPGRQKLGDGSVAAAAQHTADNYQRIAGFVQTSGERPAHRPTEHGGDRIGGAARQPGAHRDDDRYAADRVNPGELVGQLSRSRQALRTIATLTDSQLEAIPPDGSFRFCDGQRTLDQVLTSLLTHQDHQVKAVTAALA